MFRWSCTSQPSHCTHRVCVCVSIWNHFCLSTVFCLWQRSYWLCHSALVAVCTAYCAVQIDTTVHYITWLFCNHVGCRSNATSNEFFWTIFNRYPFRTLALFEVSTFWNSVLSSLTSIILSPLLTSSGAIERVSTFKLLGIHLDTNLSWSAHINSITSKGIKRLYFLKHLKRAGVPYINSFSISTLH